MSACLLHVFTGFGIGGAQVRFATLANHFGPRYRHLLVSMDGRWECTNRLGSQVDYQQVPVSIPKNRTAANYLPLRRQLAALRPDLLLTYNWGSMEWALANLPHLAPHVHVEDGFGPDEASGQLFRRVMFRRLVLAWGSVVVLPSRTLCAIAAEQWRLNPGRLRYIPNGIDLERFGRPCTEGEDLRRRPGEVLVGTVAALRPEKNLGRLIEAFAQVPPAISARLVIVGGGPERERLEATVRRLRLEDNVLLLGPMAAPERVLSQLDIFALSSDTEQMPVSLIEAMASGLPVAACDVGDVRRMLPQDNWPYVVPPDAARLAESLRVLACTPDLRRRLGQANRAHAIASYDQAGMVAAWGRLLDERMSP